MNKSKIKKEYGSLEQLKEIDWLYPSQYDTWDDEIHYEKIICPECKPFYCLWYKYGGCDALSKRIIEEETFYFYNAEQFNSKLNGS